MGRWVATLLIMVAVSAVGGTIAYKFYTAQKRELSVLAAQNMTRDAEDLATILSTMFEPAYAVTHTVESAGLYNLTLDEQTELFLDLTAGMIQRYQPVNGAYIGFANGSFIQVQDLETRVDGGPEPAANQIILTARVIDSSRAAGNEQWWIFDPRTSSWIRDFSRTATYDPRARPWYILVQEYGVAAWTNPYTFASSGVPGVTYASPLHQPDGARWGVLGIDFSLDSLSQTIAEISKAVVEDAEIVFAADPDQRLYGAFGDHVTVEAHPYMQNEAMVHAVLNRVHSTGSTGPITVQDTTFLTMGVELNPGTGMPLEIFLARDLVGIHASATEAVQRNAILIVFIIFAAAAITSYAYRLWAEVAARKKVEAALVESRDAAEAATRSKSMFLATMSHEIRTPMNGIMSMAELLSLSRLNTEQRDMLKVIGDSATSLLTIINDILDFSKIEAGKFDLEKIEFSLTDTVDGSAELLATRAHSKGLELSVGIDPTLIEQRIGDPTRLRQILLNLGGNAIKFTDEGSVEIIVSKLDGAGERLRFEVIDSGIGLSEEALGKLFTPFAQADSSTSRKYGGTGLGLSISRRLVELMGGTIGADSTLGEGSTFWFELPLTPSDAPPPSPKYDFSEIQIQTVGLSSRELGVAERYLRAGGVRNIANDERLEDCSGQEADLWLVSARSFVPGSGALDRLSGMVALIGDREDITEALEPAPARQVMRLTIPMARAAIWHAAAVAMGYEPLETSSARSREDLDYAPPLRDAAFDADALILVAEDNETNRLVIRKLLGRLGYACDIAENGKFALEKLTRPGHGLLLTDFNMPEMDGRELTQAVRANEAENGLRRLPVVALTADAMAGAEAACLEAGMDAYLTKPIDSVKLASLLAEMLPAATALRQPIATVEEEEIPAPTKELKWDPDIFDPSLLADPSGRLDAEALELIESASLDWNDKLDRIQTAFSQEDFTEARHVVHALKGASLSIGAVRLGRIASEIQDCLDADDGELAELLVAGLEPSIMEFREILPFLSVE